MLTNIYKQLIEDYLLDKNNKINSQKFKLLPSKFPDVYFKLFSRYNEYSLKSLYFSYHDNNEIPKCPICGKERLFVNFTQGFRPSCGSRKCSNNLESSVSKRKSTCLKRYGEEHYCKTKEFKEKYKTEIYPSIDQDTAKKKREETKFLKFGDSEFRNHEKRKRTCLERYGVKNFTDSPKFKDALRRRNHSQFYFKENDKLISLHTVEDIMNGKPKRFKCKECGVEFEPKQCWIGKNNVIRCVLCRAKYLDDFRGNVDLIVFEIKSIKNINYSSLINKLNVDYIAVSA